MTKFKLTITVTAEAAEKLRRPIRGAGGFQELLRRLRRGLRGNAVTLTNLRDIEKVARYFNRYGDGGFQRRLGPLARR